MKLPSKAAQEASARVARAENMIIDTDIAAYQAFKQLDGILAKRRRADKAAEEAKHGTLSACTEANRDVDHLRHRVHEAEAEVARAFTALVDARAEHSEAHDALMAIIKRDEARRVLREQRGVDVGRVKAGWRRVVGLSVWTQIAGAVGFTGAVLGIVVGVRELAGA